MFNRLISAGFVPVVLPQDHPQSDIQFQRGNRYDVILPIGVDVRKLELALNVKVVGCWLVFGENAKRTRNVSHGEYGGFKQVSHVWDVSSAEYVRVWFE